MAETREGGVYAVKTGTGVKYLDAHGKTTKAPTPDEEGSAPEPQPEAEPREKAMPYADLLAGAGYDTPEKVRAASDGDLLGIEGIGPARLAEIRAYKG